MFLAKNLYILNKSTWNHTYFNKFCFKYNRAVQHEVTDFNLFWNHTVHIILTSYAAFIIKRTITSINNPYSGVLQDLKSIKGQRNYL